MAALLDEAATSLRPLVESRGLHFDVARAEPLPALDVDARRVLPAITNHVGNAAEFATDGGRVGLTWSVAGDELRIAASDDGPGIPAPQLQHIFGAFWQARHADRRGLGLGLSIALGIAEGHGGRLWVESEVGRGSTFCLALPAQRSRCTLTLRVGRAPLRRPTSGVPRRIGPTRARFDVPSFFITRSV